MAWPEDIKINWASIGKHKTKKSNISHKEPYYCNKCNRVWQPKGFNLKRLTYLINFPIIGCYKKICIRCDKQF